MKKTFDFWNDHSRTFLTKAYQWDRRMSMEKPDGYGRKTGDCGDTVTIFLAAKNSIINRVTFEIEGCIHTNACCNALADLIEGKDVEQSWEISTHEIIEMLETLPPDHHHCAELTVGTFYLALTELRTR